MCGIFAIIGTPQLTPDEINNITTLTDLRGPDYQSPLQVYKTKHGPELTLKSSILQLRGNELQAQPVTDNSRNILLFNGEIYYYRGKALDESLSDTQFLLDVLAECKTAREITEVLSHIDGPYAVVYWHEETSCLIYGRDFFGRKSLCVARHVDTCLPHILASSAYSDNNKFMWSEVDCGGFHCLSYVSPDDSFHTFFHWNMDKIYPPTLNCRQVENKQTSSKLTSCPVKSINTDVKLHKAFSTSDITMALNVLEEKLIQAVHDRIRFTRTDCLVCRDKRQEDPALSKLICDHSKYAVAFSGGVDSVLLAFALHKVSVSHETIDLITVAFRPGSPDRHSVACAFEELRSITPTRNWRLVLCDITKQELQSKRLSLIRHLICPCQSVIDDSLGCACWFIGRAEGFAVDSLKLKLNSGETMSSRLEFDLSRETNEITELSTFRRYKSPAVLLFVGSGIDEQLGGYSSHRRAWRLGGSESLLQEISFQMRRLPTRNLGRDDRVLSVHGRDVKLPYLDFELVSALNQLPVGLKMNLDEPLESGPKKLLRNLAIRWGLVESAHRVKRAMQFGTKIANLENSKEKGSDICSRLVGQD